MPLLAIVDGQPRRAEPDGPRRASCADCGAAMLARTGSVRIWHWAHLERNPDCPAAAESEWHLAWKALALDGSQETAVGRRRADVLAPGGFAVEFQASPLTAHEVLDREDDWSAQGGMAWVFKADAEAASGRITTRPSLHKWAGTGLVKPQNQATLDITWSHAPERVRAAFARTFLDTGNDELLFIGGRRPGMSPLTFYGWRVSKDWVVHNLLHADTIPAPLAEDPADVERRIREWQDRERLRKRRERALKDRPQAVARSAARLRAQWKRTGRTPPPPGSFERWAEQIVAGVPGNQIRMQMEADRRAASRPLGEARPADDEEPQA